MAKKILIVDDEEPFVKVLKARLEANGYEVITAPDGKEGLKQVDREHPDLIVLDIIMPNMDGTAMSEALKSGPDTRDIPVIFLTCLIDKEEAACSGYQIAGKHFLAKPFEAGELLAMIEKIFNKEI